MLPLADSVSYQDYIQGTFQAMQVINDNMNDNYDDDHPDDDNDDDYQDYIRGGWLQRQNLCFLVLIFSSQICIYDKESANGSISF